MWTAVAGHHRRAAVMPSHAWPTMSVPPAVVSKPLWTARPVHSSEAASKTIGAMMPGEAPPILIFCSEPRTARTSAATGERLRTTAPRATMRHAMGIAAAGAAAAGHHPKSGTRAAPKHRWTTTLAALSIVAITRRGTKAETEHRRATAIAISATRFGRAAPITPILTATVAVQTVALTTIAIGAIPLDSVGRHWASTEHGRAASVTAFSVAPLACWRAKAETEHRWPTAITLPAPRIGWPAPIVTITVGTLTVTAFARHRPSAEHGRAAAVSLSASGLGRTSSIALAAPRRGRSATIIARVVVGQRQRVGHACFVDRGLPCRTGF